MGASKVQYHSKENLSKQKIFGWKKTFFFSDFLQPTPVSEDIDDSSEAQIVVDLKQLGVNLDKDVGRSIQKDDSESDTGSDPVDVSKSKLNPGAIEWTPSLPKAVKTPNPISKERFKRNIKFNFDYFYIRIIFALF